jgi:hypothetical protein
MTVLCSWKSVLQDQVPIDQVFYIFPDGSPVRILSCLLLEFNPVDFACIMLSGHAGSCELSYKTGSFWH